MARTADIDPAQYSSLVQLLEDDKGDWLVRLPAGMTTRGAREPASVLSLEPSMPRVLVSDTISDKGLEILRSSPGLEVTYEPGLKEDQLAARLPGC